MLVACGNDAILNAANDNLGIAQWTDVQLIFFFYYLLNLLSMVSRFLLCTVTEMHLFITLIGNDNLYSPSPI
jgi:hypothetical protein